MYSFVFHSFITRHCHWCCITAASPVSIMGQGHLDMFSSSTKKFYCIVISCMALNTYVLFNYRHCFIKSWWNPFGFQRFSEAPLVSTCGKHWILLYVKAAALEVMPKWDQTPKGNQLSERLDICPALCPLRNRGLSCFVKRVLMGFLKE